MGESNDEEGREFFIEKRERERKNMCLTRFEQGDESEKVMNLFCVNRDSIPRVRKRHLTTSSNVSLSSFSLSLSLSLSHSSFFLFFLFSLFLLSFRLREKGKKEKEKKILETKK